MQVLGVRHHHEDAQFPAVLRYLSRFRWEGKTVAIEETNNRFRSGKDNFWKLVAEHIESRGGRIVLVDSSHLRDQQSLEHARFNKKGSKVALFKERKANLLRTIAMVEKSQHHGASMLITGVAHAFDIKKMLGRRANVRIIARPNSMRRYGYYAETIRELRNVNPGKFREMTQRVMSAARKAEKMKRPLLQKKRKT